MLPNHTIQSQNSSLNLPCVLWSRPWNHGTKQDKFTFILNSGRIWQSLWDERIRRFFHRCAVSSSCGTLAGITSNMYDRIIIISTMVYIPISWCWIHYDVSHVLGISWNYPLRHVLPSHTLTKLMNTLSKLCSRCTQTSLEMISLYCWNSPN